MDKQDQGNALVPQKSVISFVNYVINKLSLQANPNYKPIDGAAVEMKINLSHSANIDDDKHSAAVSVCCTVSRGERGEEPFSLEIELIGYFTYISDLEREQRDALLNVNTTAILFPYLRAIVSSITALSGFKPLILPIFNVQQMFDAQGGQVPATKG